MPVNTVSRRLGISTLMSLRLFTRAPCTRITSWLSATCSAGDCVSVLVVMLIVPPSVRPGRLRGLRRRRLARSYQLRAVRLVLLRSGPWSLWATATRRSAEDSDRPAAIAHQLAVGQLVHLAPGLDAARGDAEPAVRRGLRTRVEAGARGEPVTPLPRQRVDLEDLDFAIDDGRVGGCGPALAERFGWWPGSCRSGCPSAWPPAAPRRPSRRTAAPGTAHRPMRHWWPPRHRRRG